MKIDLFNGDCLDVMRGMDAESVDAIVTDPPYGLKFMGKRWDHGVPSAEVWREALRVLKPGGHMLAFGGTRTYHRLVCAIEDAGFEIRDQIAWVYGSGFPKSHNLEGDWQGWGTALKPAHEPIVLARRPLSGTVTANAKAHGTGALNIDGCRVPMNGEVNPSIARRKGAINHLSDRPAKETEAEGKMASRQSPEAFRAEREGEMLGRWPANLIHDGSDEATAVFPKDATRFFYCAKASKADREDGLDHREPIHRPDGNKWTDQDYRVISGERPPSAESGPRRNHHPTVKPTELMRYLCRLITPPGGTVLDPFMGSGSTGRGAIMEGFGFIGIEIDPDYLAIANDRISACLI